MPVKRLSSEDYVFLEYIILDFEEGHITDDDLIGELNHFFAKIYGYKRSGRSKSRRSGTRAPPKKKKVSAYAKRYGAAFKKLKRKHPRMSFGSLSKKAHKQSRRKK